MNPTPLKDLYKNVNHRATKSASDKKQFDFIVIGLGSMGSSVIYHLSKAGYAVLGLEQFNLTHENGSHAGQSRLIRQAYFEHPDYVPLLKKAYQGWETLENESRSQLFYKTGILYSGPAHDFLISGSLESALKHDIEVRKISHKEQNEQYSQFDLPSHYSTIFEPNAGFVTPERAILTYINESLNHNAVIHSNELVISWQENFEGITVRTNKEQYSAQKLIFTTGAWVNNLLPELQPELKVTRQSIFWVNTRQEKHDFLRKMPCWGVNQEDLPGLFYGFPILDEDNFGGPAGLKIGYHYPGEITDPVDKTKDISTIDKAIIVDFMESFMPGTFESFNVAKTCLYTYSPDDNFIIDHHPKHTNAIIATGFSGHGFKFIPVVGQALADLAIDGKSDLPIDFLGLDRLA